MSDLPAGKFWIFWDSNVRIHTTTKIEMQIRQGILRRYLKASISMFQRFIREIINRLTTSDIDIVVGAVIGLIPHNFHDHEDRGRTYGTVFYRRPFYGYGAGHQIAVCISAVFTAGILNTIRIRKLWGRMAVRSYGKEYWESIVIESFANEHAVCGNWINFKKILPYSIKAWYDQQFCKYILYGCFVWQGMRRLYGISDFIRADDIRTLKAFADYSADPGMLPVNMSGLNSQ